MKLWYHDMLNITQNVPPSMSVEVEAAPEETNQQGWLKNVTKQKFSSPMTADKMDNEDILIHCKMKGCETG